MKYIISSFIAVSLCLVPANATGFLNLPTFDPETAAHDGDWLVSPPAEVAKVYRAVSASDNEFVLSNGLISRTFRVAPNAVTVGFDNLTTGESILRGVKPEASVTIDGATYAVGGLSGQPNYAYLRRDWIDDLAWDPKAMQYDGMTFGPIEAHIEWKRVRHHAPDAVWPPKGIHVRMNYRMPGTEPNESRTGLRVSVHYALYDGIPVMAKWLTIENGTDRDIVLDRFTSEILAAVEYSSYVEQRGPAMETPNIHVETDYSFGGMATLNTMKSSVHWVTDPDYTSQVNYNLQTPCLLEVRPNIGPSATIAPGETFETFRVYVMPYDSTDRERKGLAQRAMYRNIAPWITENPLMMHVRFADWDSVKTAIDQCAAVGFEMVILTFGSGFSIEDDSDKYIAEMTKYADYAREKGIEIGGYSLLASRSIDEENDVVMPEGESPTFGNSPCLLSDWSEDYFRKLYAFYEKTGFMLLEHDGSYPGDACTSESHDHKGYDDSRWSQWRKISDFYRWCRARGIYLNVPDYYYLMGSTKCGMGYREVNWSLPRAQQVIHTRQNIYDGTWQKTPSMGWMFVPLTEYHGGGEAATIEPLDDHRDHYRAMMASNLGLGVQACYRGPRLFDTDRTRAMVADQVAWFKTHRNILESDVIHGRRADGRDVDWMLHVNSQLDTKGMLLAYNPLDEAVARTLTLNLYYTGLTESTTVSGADGETKTLQLNRDYEIEVDVRIPAQGYAWYAFK